MNLFLQTPFFYSNHVQKRNTVVRFTVLRFTTSRENITGTADYLLELLLTKTNYFIS